MRISTINSEDLKRRIHEGRQYIRPLIRLGLPLILANTIKMLLIIIIIIIIM
jgi:uncharacterized protein with PQ loop repeat